ncbi:hypothetical protein AVEN_261328-1 [Araneus ventricosus]|uniref:Uncharacterized protein n=1 Tax=Araneus ventricosus TaxID=182803 RepID=A0A4Y2TYI9_ARAVE|nr:hypothetical protein AVEN_261328-1 [Araneus ventricosus]
MRFSFTPLNQDCRKKRHELDSLNWWSFSHHPTLRYDLPLKAHGNGLWLERMGGLPYAASLSDPQDTPLQRSQPPQTGLLRC